MLPDAVFVRRQKQHTPPTHEPDCGCAMCLQTSSMALATSARSLICAEILAQASEQIHTTFCSVVPQCFTNLGADPVHNDNQTTNIVKAVCGIHLCTLQRRSFHFVVACRTVCNQHFASKRLRSSLRYGQASSDATDREHQLPGPSASN